MEYFTGWMSFILLFFIFYNFLLDFRATERLVTGQIWSVGRSLHHCFKGNCLLAQWAWLVIETVGWHTSSDLKISKWVSCSLVAATAALVVVTGKCTASLFYYFSSSISRYLWGMYQGLILYNSHYMPCHFIQASKQVYSPKTILWQY